MKNRAGLLLTCATGALLVGAGAHPASAADPAPPASAPSEWWTNGVVEIGGRVFISKQGGRTAGNQQSLGKFYEYRDLRPGPIGGFLFTAGTKDGLYVVDIGGRNIGYDDQNYTLDVNKAGEHYFTFVWDQTPHTYNDVATTIYSGVGSNNLTLSNAFRSSMGAITPPASDPLSPAAGNDPPRPTTNAQRTTIANLVNGNLNTFHLGFRRDVAAAEYRWTPDEAWDVKADYTRIRRDGTQPVAVMTYQMAPSGTAAAERNGRVMLEVPKPIADTTHNANASAEYAGTTPWGKKYNISLGGGYSAYQNDYAAFGFQNPWIPNGANSAIAPLDNSYSLAPDNSAATARVNGGVDLPFNSRYVAAMNYTMARQDDQFLPFTVNPALPPQIISQASLNGGNNTLLVNNVLTTSWTPNVKSTLRYRYYDFDSITDPISVSGWYVADGNILEGPHTYFPMAYTKQNASADGSWRPLKWLTVGGGYYWERWDRDRRDVNVTDEHTGKLFADAKPVDWAQIRATYLHSERRYDSYTPITNPDAPYSTYRLFDMANRSRDKGTLSIDLYSQDNVTFTPTAGFRIDDYGTDPYGPSRELGLLRDESWNAGLEISWRPSRDVTVMASYMHEEIQRNIMAHQNTSMLDVQVADRIETFMIGAKAIMVPNKLDVSANLLFSTALGRLGSHAGPVFVGNPTTINPEAFPDITQQFTRFDLQARYAVDPEVVQKLGWTGETFVRLRYMWERAVVDDWSTVNQNYLWLINPTGGTVFNKSVFMGWNNPNYNVQLVTVSLGVKW
jgi:MtrB/PioB family decaheme-associated outer membrane protein